MLYELVIVEVLSSAHALDMFYVCVSKVNCYESGTNNSFVLGNGSIPYLVDDVLLP